MLALFAQMERTYTLERAAHAREVATAKGRRAGRPPVVTESQLAHAIQLRDAGATAAEITAKTGMTRSTLYRHLPPRPADQVTAAAPLAPVEALTENVALPPVSAANPRPGDDRLMCPTCGYRPPTSREAVPHLNDLDTVWLHLDSTGRVSEQRHCVRCQPHERVTAVACGRCGDGPLVIGTEPDADLSAATRRWLEEQGWRTTPNLLCSNHI